MKPPEPADRSEAAGGLSDENLAPVALDDSVSNEELEKQVEGKLHGFEEGFRRKHPVVWALTLVIPFLLLGGAILAVWWFEGGLFATKLIGAATATFFVLGRFVILFGQQGELGNDWDFLSPFQLFLMVSYMDFAAALLVAFHVGAMFQLPWLGKRAASLVEDARFVLDKFPWMRRAAFTGLTLFVAFPLAATGAVGGSILGTLLGLSRLRVYLATVMGCLLGNGLLYLAAERIDDEIANHPVVRYGGIATILGVIVLMEYRYRKSKQKYQAEHPHQ